MDFAPPFYTLVRSIYLSTIEKRSIKSRRNAIDLLKIPDEVTLII